MQENHEKLKISKSTKIHEIVMRPAAQAIMHTVLLFKRRLHGLQPVQVFSMWEH